MKKIDIQTVQRLVWRLANQLPTRYYLNYMGEPTHFVIEVWEHRHNPFPEKLDKELKGLGFDFKEKVNWDTYTIYQWIAERKENTISDTSQ